ncbi:MAG: hypothetical protein ACLRWH_03775 [Emergencia sp.]|nr:hypothetical protein [Emergencia sp.]
MPENYVHMLNTKPRSQVSIETVEDRLNISSTIKGAGIQIIVIEKMDQDE